MSDSAPVSVSVAAPLELAFEIFTTQIDHWWRRGIKFRHAGSRQGLIHLEPQLDGRIFESYDGPQGPAVVECGRMLSWDPPKRLAFSWRLLPSPRMNRPM